MTLKAVLILLLAVGVGLGSLNLGSPRAAAVQPIELQFADSSNDLNFIDGNGSNVGQAPPDHPGDISLIDVMLPRG